MLRSNTAAMVPAGILFFHIKCSFMLVPSISFSNATCSIPFSYFPGRRRRAWVSFTSVGCYNDAVVYVIWRCPVVSGIALIYLAWQHRIVPA